MFAMRDGVYSASSLNRADATNPSRFYIISFLVQTQYLAQGNYVVVVCLGGRGGSCTILPISSVTKTRKQVLRANRIRRPIPQNA